MKLVQIVLALFCISFVSSQGVDKKLFDANNKIHGEVTFYGKGSDSGGRCLYNNPTHNPSNLPTVAIGAFGNAEKCGMCVKIYPSQSGGAGNSDFKSRAPFVAYVNNECPECGPNNLDLAQDSGGRWNMDWHAVECPVSGNIQLQVKSGSSQYHTEISARNFRVPIAKFEFLLGGTWSSLERKPYNFFYLPRQISLPATIRLTSITGESKEATIFANGYGPTEPALIQTSIQFSGMTGGSSPSTPSTPQNPPTTPPSSGSCAGVKYAGDGNDYWIEVAGTPNDKMVVNCANGQKAACKFQYEKQTCQPDAGQSCPAPRSVVVNSKWCPLDAQATPPSSNPVPPPPPPPVVRPPPPTVTPPPPPPVVSPPPPVVSPPPPTTPNSSPYAKLLQYSLMFYEAQRAGKLPANKRIPWRGDSFLQDGSDNGVDLAGGYMDAGDHYKFNFPMAFSMTTLAWGAIDYKAGYQSAGHWNYVKKTIKWGTDYFLKCWKEDTKTLWGQVGNNAHQVWKAPEDYTQQELNSLRKSSAINPSNPGADLAGETAAALAAASMVFKTEDPAYSTLLLSKARTLYAFALSTKGSVYHDAIPEAAKYYKSWSGSNDELCWAGAWLYRATGEQQYLTNAMANWGAVADIQGPLSWDNKAAGAKVLLAQITTDPTVKAAARKWAENVVSSRNTPDGLIWFGDDISKWGSLRHAMNAMFPLSIYADKVETDATFKTNAINRVIGQVGYVLGQNRMKVNYVVGADASSPKKPHHRGASGTTEADPGPNRNILFGALVGGPDSTGFWEDSRTDYVKNEVATDYNAGFTGVMARFVEKAVSGVIITPPAPVVPNPTNPGGSAINCNDLAHAEDPSNLYWVEVWAPATAAISVQCADGKVLACTLAFGVKFQCAPGTGNQCNHPRNVITASGQKCPLPQNKFRATAVADEGAFAVAVEEEEQAVAVEVEEEAVAEEVVAAYAVEEEVEEAVAEEVVEEEEEEAVAEEEEEAVAEEEDEEEQAVAEEVFEEEDYAVAENINTNTAGTPTADNTTGAAIAIVVVGCILAIALVAGVMIITKKKAQHDMLSRMP